MECLFGFFLVIAGIVWLVNKIQESSLAAQMKRASQQGKWTEYYRLSNILRERALKEQRANKDAQANQNFLGGLFALDAAQNGVFSPQSEEAVRRADRAFAGDNDSYDEEEDDSDHYDDYTYEPPDKGEASDHWGPV